MAGDVVKKLMSFVQLERKQNNEIDYLFVFVTDASILFNVTTIASCLFCKFIYSLL